MILEILRFLSPPMAPVAAAGLLVAKEYYYFALLLDHNS